MTTKTYIDTKDTAKLVRQALKEAFPGAARHAAEWVLSHVG